MWFLTDTLLNPPDQNRQKVRRKRKVCRLQPAFFGGHLHFLPLPAWPGCMHVRGGGGGLSNKAFHHQLWMVAVMPNWAGVGSRCPVRKRGTQKKTAAWPFCLARCACCPLFDLSSSSVSTVRHARTHGTHRDARWLAGKARWLTGPRVGTSFRSPGHARAMRVTVAAARPTTCLFLAAVPGAVVFPR